MKELSIEEKAKRYDEALEKARQLCAYPTTKSFKSDLQDLFPELAESEDERIRKEIIAWLKNSEGQTLPIDRYNAAMDWLEKQGEQKPAWSEEDEATFTVIGSLILDNFSAEDASKALTWLHSLRPQNTWKPSDEQMEALDNALSLAKNCGEKSAFHLRTLYEQLKKL